MINSNGFVTDRTKAFTRHFAHFMPTFGPWQKGLWDHDLTLGHVRDMRISIKRNPVRAKLCDAVQGVDKRFCRLPGEAIKKINVQAFNPVPAHMINHMAGLFKTLRASNGFLHGWVEILHANAGPPHAPMGQAVQNIIRRFSRVHFDRKLEILGTVEMLVNLKQQTIQERRA